MSGKSIISNSYLEDIGDAIRYKKGTEETFYPSQMGDAIRSIEGIVPVGSIEIDANGTYNVTDKAEAVVSVQPDLRPLSVSENGQYSPDDFDGYSDVTVDVEPALDSLTVTENGLYLPTVGVDGYDRVTVDVPQPSGSTTITENGTYDVSEYASAVVNTDIQWDGTLYPVTDESDALYADHVFNAKHVPVVAGDTVIVEGVGRGRWFGWYRGVKGGDYASNSTTYSPMANNGFGKARYTLPITADATTLVLCGYEWTNDGTHSGNATYCYFGEYLRWKVIHQP